ncbi:hypothetical protein EVAR_77624_1 [Eumeta japonica]|uniref:Uncharacterized protein n=1 Tax=Eumeta variegata TaxID=151549 RepID=A0A4C1TA99_EUMVA|nr:hypothetical protein EVAR_77624_1 [Eumeta japonica]
MRNRSHRTLNPNNESERWEPNCAICKTTPHRPSDWGTMKKTDCEARWNLAKRLPLYFRCLHYKSSSHQCKAIKCNLESCVKTHHPLLHSARPTTDGKKERNIVASTHTQKPSAACAFLKIVPVRMTGLRGHVDTHALLDDGSTVTLVDTALTTRIGVLSMKTTCLLSFEVYCKLTPTHIYTTFPHP